MHRRDFMRTSLPAPAAASMSWRSRVTSAANTTDTVRKFVEVAADHPRCDAH